jgi:hypothetical protein
MPISFSCPECKVPLNVPDHFGGKRSKCPKCNARVMIPQQSVPSKSKSKPEVEVENDGDPFAFGGGGKLVSSAAHIDLSASTGLAPEEEPLQIDPRSDEAESWRTVSRGLNNIWLGTCVSAIGLTITLLVTGLLFMIGATPAELMAGAQGAGAAPPARSGVMLVRIELHHVMIAIGVILFFMGLGVLLRLLGFIRTLWIPEGTANWFLALLCIPAELLQIAGLGLTGLAPLLSSGLYFLVGLAGFAVGFFPGLLFLMLYMRGVGVALRSKVLPGRAMRFFIWLLGGLGYLFVTVGGFILVVLLSDGQASGLGRMLFYAGYGGSFIVFLVWLMKYLGVLAQGMDDIRKRVGKA